MSRIKLPGKEKNKRILLFVLVLIALGIIAHEFIENRNSKDNKYKEEKEIVMPEGTQQSDNNVANKELESIDMKNDSKKAVDDKTNESLVILKGKMNYTTKHIIYFFHISTLSQ